eukprot:6846885-Prymnesium_polylepis.1
MSKRTREQEDLDRGVALSLSEHPADLPPAPADLDDDLNRAIAASLADSSRRRQRPPPSDAWDCRICTLSNDGANGRCAACGSDRVAPHAAALACSSPPGRADLRCGLPGCNRPRSHYDFCSEEHQRRAAARGLLPTQSEGEDRVFCGASGDYACALLTNKSTERAGVVSQFREAWRKPTALPRVER